jgi:hypothetical protein
MWSRTWVVYTFVWQLQSLVELTANCVGGVTKLTCLFLLSGLSHEGDMGLYMTSNPIVACILLGFGLSVYVLMRLWLFYLVDPARDMLI